MLLIVLAASVPAVVWSTVARSRRARWTIYVALGSLTALALGADILLPRTHFETRLGYLPLAMLIIWIGRSIEVRRRGPTRSGRLLYRGAVALALLVALVLTPWIFITANQRPFPPRSDEFLPMQLGLDASTGSTACDAGSCALHLSITPNSGQSTADAVAQVRAHALVRGWRLDRGETCKPHGWLLDARLICLDIIPGTDEVQVVLTAHRAWL